VIRAAILAGALILSGCAAPAAPPALAVGGAALGFGAAVFNFDTELAKGYVAWREGEFSPACREPNPK